MMHTAESIKALLDANDRAVMRALVALYERQTADEQANAHTSHLNGMGFNGYDAEFGTSLAKQVIRGCILSPRQIAAGRKMCKKYARQLAEVANAKAGALAA